MGYNIGECLRFGGYVWQVLDIQGCETLLLCKDVIFKRHYNGSYKNTTWEKCSLRKYLNGKFFDLLGKENTRISLKNIITNNNPWYGIKGGKAANDKIFLLSIEEVVWYFGDSGELINRPLNYYMINDYMINDQYNRKRIAYDDTGSAKGWCLRSPGELGSYTVFVDYCGIINVKGISVYHSDLGVRPALWLNKTE